jgi:hypothetical protein
VDAVSGAVLDTEAFGNFQNGEYAVWNVTGHVQIQVTCTGQGNPPPYATVSLTGDTLHTWAAPTSDVRALQTASGSSSRIASAFYSATSFTIDVNLTNGNAHRIALYLLDWEGSHADSISIVNAASGAVLDTKTSPSFTNGEYAVWTVTGHVQIQVTRTGVSNGLVSGVFFD